MNLKDLIGTDVALPFGLRIVAPLRQEVTEAGGLVSSPEDSWLTWEFDVLTEPDFGLQSQSKAIQLAMLHRGAEFEAHVLLDDVTAATDVTRAVSSITGRVATLASALPASSSMWCWYAVSGRKLLNAIVALNGARTQATLARKGPVAATNLNVGSTPQFLVQISDIGRVGAVVNEQGIAQTQFTLRAVVA